jgi:hypothetical protein
MSRVSDSPRLAQQLLRFLLPMDEVEPTLGDLEEEFLSNAVRAGHAHAIRIYWKEAMDAIFHSAVRGIERNRIPLFAMASGLLGGELLIVSSVLARGPMIFVTYAGLMLVVGLYLRLMRVNPFASRFRLGLGSFMTATVTFYLFVTLILHPHAREIPLLGHVWRIGLMLALGGAASIIIATLTSKDMFPALPVAYIPAFMYAWLIGVRPRSAAVPFFARFVLPFGMWGHEWWYAGLDILLWTVIAYVIVLGMRQRGRRFAR